MGRTTYVELLLFLICCVAVTMRGQTGPEAGGNEVQFWAGGGHSVAGGTGNTEVVNAGLRYGWVLTGLHGPGFLKGRLEYTVDAVPLAMVFQRANTAYGLGFNPFGLKWNFGRHGSISPFFELGGGLLFTTHRVPPGTSSANFTPQAAIGIQHLGERMTWGIEARYLHISDAGLTSFNPGINTFQVRLGLGAFRRP